MSLKHKKRVETKPNQSLIARFCYPVSLPYRYPKLNSSFSFLHSGQKPTMQLKKPFRRCVSAHTRDDSMCKKIVIAFCGHACKDAYTLRSVIFSPDPPSRFYDRWFRRRNCGFFRGNSAERKIVCGHGYDVWYEVIIRLLPHCCTVITAEVVKAVF